MYVYMINSNGPKTEYMTGIIFAIFLFTYAANFAPKIRPIVSRLSRSFTSSKVTSSDTHDCLCNPQQLWACLAVSKIKRRHLSINANFHAYCILRPSWGCWNFKTILGSKNSSDGATRLYRVLQYIFSHNTIIRQTDGQKSHITCNLSFGTRGFRTAAPTIWNSLSANVRSCETLNIPSTFKNHTVFSTASHCLVTHLSASDAFRPRRYINLLTYLLINAACQYVDAW